MAVGPVVEGKASRDVWIEVNGEVRAVAVEDKNSAVETSTREKATSDPGSVGCPMSGVVVEVRVKEGQEVKKGDGICVLSAMKVSLKNSGGPACGVIYVFIRWRRPSVHQLQATSNVSSCTKVRALCPFTRREDLALIRHMISHCCHFRRLHFTRRPDCRDRFLRRRIV